MLIEIPTVLGASEVALARDLLGQCRFVDGRLSAGMLARRVKRNREVAGDDARLEQLNNLVMGQLVRHPVYASAALPLRVAAPYYARYREGDAYGAHIDDPITGQGTLYRADVAITVFLSEPRDYAGGELMVEGEFGERAVKLAAGHAILYPASSRHRIAPLERGERLVAVTWVQSLVRDPQRRRLLFELGQARDALLREAPQSESTQRVGDSYANLMRMWAEL